MPSLNTGNAILSNPIKVDSSYNVGIGGAASGSFKLQVTGTGNFTGALSGTSADFTGAVGTGVLTSTISSAVNAIFNSTNANGGYITFRRSGTPIGYLGNSAQLGAGVLNALELRADNDLILTTTSGSLRLTSGGVVGIGVTPASQSGGAYAGSAEMAGILRIQGGGGRYFTSGDGMEISKTSIYSYNRNTSSYNTIGINDAMTIVGGGNVGIGLGGSTLVTTFQIRNNSWQQYISKSFTSQTNVLSVNLKNNGAAIINVTSSAYRPGVDTYAQTITYLIICRGEALTISTSNSAGQGILAYSTSGSTFTLAFGYAGGGTNFQNAFVNIQGVSQNGFEEAIVVTLL